MKDPVTLKRYNRWYEAEQARDHLKSHEVDAFIIFDGPLAGMGAEVDQKAFPSVQLVARVNQANKAHELLEDFAPAVPSPGDSTSRFSGMSFYRQSAWMVTVFSLFYIVSFIVKGVYTSTYLVPAGVVLLTAAVFFFCCVYMEKRKSAENVLGQPGTA